MRSIMKNLFTSHMRNPTAEEDYIFYMQSILGDGLKDSITGVPAITSISGTRYGIVNGVTQFAANQPPIEDTGLRGCPAFTQLAKMSETLTDALWVKPNITAPVLDGSVYGTSVYFIGDGSNSLTKYWEQFNAFSTTADNTYNNISCVVKRKNRHLRLYLLRKDGVYGIAYFDLINGTVQSTSGGMIANISPLGNGWYHCWASVNVLSGSTSFVGVSGGNYALLNDSFIAAYTGLGSTYGLWVAQQSIYNSGTTPSILPYVPNNTSGSISVVSETATATTGTSFDLDNALLARLKTALRGPNAQGRLELTFKSNTDSSWWANNSVYNILSVNNTAASLLYINKDSGGVVTFRATDGTNVASITQGLVVGSSYKVALDWGAHSTGQKIRITVNGVKSSLVDCGSSLGAEDLMFFALSGIHAGWIVKDSLKVMDRPIW